MSLPRRPLTQEERIQLRLAIIPTQPDQALLLETARFLKRTADRLDSAGQHDLATELHTQRMMIERHLGILWDWREDLPPRPDAVAATVKEHLQSAGDRQTNRATYDATPAPNPGVAAPPVSQETQE